MATERPHSREFSQEARDRLGSAVQAAREGAGHPYRPSFAQLAGAPLSVRSLLKLEKGEPVGAKVYEAAGRTLGHYYRDWSAETPLAILTGSDESVPSGQLRRGITIVGQNTTHVEIEKHPQPPPVEQSEPDPSDFADLEEYLRATINHLIRQGMPSEAVMRAVDQVIADYQRVVAQGDEPEASGNGGSANG